MINISNALFEYAVAIRRRLHEYPEVGFELDKTVALVTEELTKIGLTPTHKYGKGSVAAELGQGDRLLAIRADMDALPIEEKTDLPFTSKIPGQMHACGHDAHTAVLLSVARYMKENEEKLGCRVRLIFQPSEEGAISGAKMMVENGVMDGVDHILCAHGENRMPVGTIGICEGDHMAACVPATIRFIGKSSHATSPQHGVDANAMVVEAYQKMQEMVQTEAAGIPYIWSVGRISGGFVHNVISALCEMDISFRFYDMEFAARVEKKVREICNSIAERFGGRCEICWNMSTGPVHNDIKIAKRMQKVLSSENIPVETVKRRMSSEDFGWYLTKAPGMLLRFGTQEKDCRHVTVPHNSDYYMDEEGMKAAIAAFASYVFAYGKRDGEEEIL